MDVGLLTPGERLVARYREEQHFATVNRDGSIRLDGLDFSSLSSAANSIVSAKRVNGWAFWRLGSGERLIEVRARFQSG